MRPFREIEAEQVRSIKYILCDIDDTLTNAGKLTAEAYSALWKLRDAGYEVIPVTGRPAGWCDLIVRQWPVSAVVGENGAFAYYERAGKKQVLTHPNVAKDFEARLEAVKQAVLEQVPGSRVSKDQFSRIYDLAIDFREEPPLLSFDDAERIRACCVSMGAEAKVSSIHVNTWFGKYNKLDMSLRTLAELFGETNAQQHVLFFGDSPNDEPMFRYFPLSCGVENIKPFLGTLQHLPAFIADGEGGFGFSNSVERITKKVLECPSKL